MHCMAVTRARAGVRLDETKPKTEKKSGEVGVECFVCLLHQPIHLILFFILLSFLLHLLAVAVCFAVREIFNGSRLVSLRLLPFPFALRSQLHSPFLPPHTQK